MKSKILQLINGIMGLAITGMMLTMPLLSPQLALAQTPTPAQSDDSKFVTCGNDASHPCTVGHLFRSFVVIVNYLIVMAGFVAVLAIVYAGFLMVYSQGDDGSGLKDAKGRLSGAVIGLVLVAFAYVLINALFSGSFSIGVCNGETILTDPKAYINSTGNCS